MTGIGFSRLPFDDSTSRKELEIAIQTSRSYWDRGPLNLCCGRLSRLELFNETHQDLQSYSSQIYLELKNQLSESGNSRVHARQGRARVYSLEATPRRKMPAPGAIIKLTGVYGQMGNGKKMDL